MKTNLRRQQVAEILRRFNEAYTFDLADLNKPQADQILQQLIDDICPQEDRPRIQAEFFGHGPLEELLSDATVLEIVINGDVEIWFEHDGQFNRHQDEFLNELTFKRFIDRLAQEAQMRIDLSRPFADGRWRDFRLHLACAPLTHCSYHVTMRKVPNQPWTLQRLQELNWCTPEQMQILQSLIKARKNCLVIGPTGCGKTSVLTACLRELPGNERTVIIEDTDELPLPNPASTKMLSRTHASEALSEVTMNDLVKQSLRMRPLRLVVGEVRGAEAKDLLLALATGHSGSWGTLHASDARQALLRLEMLVQMGAPQWNLQAIRQLLHLSVDALIVCGNENGHRCLQGIFKVAALESFGILIEPLHANVDV
jgi:pilus assembly protein CpaF